MPSYKNLAITALAASFVSPALSAPIGSSQKQSRAEIDAHPLFLFPYSNSMVPGAVPPAPGGSSKRAADAPESRAIVELEGRGAPVRPVTVQTTVTQTVRPCTRCGSGGRKPAINGAQKAVLAGGAAALVGAGVGAGAYVMHKADEVGSAPPPGDSSRTLSQAQTLPQTFPKTQQVVPSSPNGGNSKRDNAILLAPLPNNGLSGVRQRDVLSSEEVAVSNALNQRADVPPEDVALRVLGRALNGLD